MLSTNWPTALGDAEADAIVDAIGVDEMDAPSDWDAGTITFDPYVI